MKQRCKIGLKFFVLLFFISFVEAREMCIDFYVPFAPESLFISGFENNVSLQWGAAKDLPACGEISYYNVYRDGNLINISGNLSFIDKNVSYGNYTYSVRGVDKAGHEGNAVERKFRVISAASNTESKAIKLKSKTKKDNSNFSVYIQPSENESNLSSQGLPSADGAGISGMAVAAAEFFKKMDTLRKILLISIVAMMIALVFLRIGMMIRGKG